MTKIQVLLTGGAYTGAIMSVPPVGGTAPRELVLASRRNIDGQRVDAEVYRLMEEAPRGSDFKSAHYAYKDTLNMPVSMVDEWEEG